jgi:hypothetical protein
LHVSFHVAYADKPIGKFNCHATKLLFEQGAGMDRIWQS